jgi:tRNA(fMet)-specific endonuclease VapC
MYLLDTDTVIYILKGHLAVAEHLKGHLHDTMKISIVTYMELYYGAYKSQRVTANAARVKALGQAIEMAPINAAVAETFGMIKAALESGGHRLDDFDMAIAATALSYNLILVTNNTDHFSRIDGLRLENWTVSYPIVSEKGGRYMEGKVAPRGKRSITTSRSRKRDT